MIRWSFVMVKMCKYQTGLNTGVERCYTSRVWKFYTHAVTLLRNWFVSEYPLKIDQNYHPRGETSRATYIKQSKLEPLHPRYVHGCHKSQAFTHRLPLSVHITMGQIHITKSYNFVDRFTWQPQKEKIMCFCHSGK